MGKSRLLDEFSRGLFMIPINLRPAKSDGTSYLLLPVIAHQTRLLDFPPADDQVHDFLSGLGESYKTSAKLAYPRAHNFLLALFTKTKETLNGTNKAERSKSSESLCQMVSRCVMWGEIGKDFTVTLSLRLEMYVVAP